MRHFQKILLLLLIATIPSKAQTFFAGSEYGVSMGGSQYFGDLNDNYGFKFVRPAVGVFSRLHLNPYISLRASLNYTLVGYNDNLSDDQYDKQRNLNFQSNIVEGVAQAEFNFFRFETGEQNSRFTPYLTGGIGVFYFNPFTYFEGKKYNLRTLGTEGQNAGYNDRKYSNFAVCFPIGVGVKYWVRPGMNLGFEITDRFTTTDYLDDVSSTYVGADKFPTDPKYPSPAHALQDRSVELGVSDPLGRAGKQRGNSSTNDQYLMFVVNLSFQLKVYRCPGYMKHGFMKNTRSSS